MDDPWVIAGTAGAVVAAVIAALALRKRVHRHKRVRARDVFPELRPQAERCFIEAASSSGKPRGLRWKDVRFHEGQVFAIDRVSGALYALVGATISFEAVEGGPMEGVEAVSNLRAGTAVFVFRNGEWTTEGRAVFNLMPEETLDRYQSTLEPFEMT